ncbi:DUF302 domain-containing protein [Streptomyces sp. NBC_00631]|uniref:DUF302 domain-containing protein n=1 Tax=Streptomyces sp. NBC_00631 TaxID=2975793 RepID=UPI0030E1052F
MTFETTRYAIDTGQGFDAFVAQYEKAVPAFDPAMVLGVENWDQALANVKEAAPWGFLIYSRIDPSPVFRISGVGKDDTRSIAYLMGNHTIAETMYRHNPNAILYAPLRVLVYENGEGNAVISFDRPSNLFASFGDADIEKVGHLLDTKVADLLTHLGVPLPVGFSR